MKGSELRVQPFIAEPGWYHGAREAFVPVIWDGGFCVFQAAEKAFRRRSRSLDPFIVAASTPQGSHSLRPCRKDFLSSLMKRGVHT
jgi:hypothetical protein